MFTQIWPSLFNEIADLMPSSPSCFSGSGDCCELPATFAFFGIFLALVLKPTTFTFRAQRRRLHVNQEFLPDCRIKIIPKEKHFKGSPLRTNLKFRENICAEVLGQRTVLALFNFSLGWGGWL